MKKDLNIKSINRGFIFLILVMVMVVGVDGQGCTSTSCTQANGGGLTIPSSIESGTSSNEEEWELERLNSELWKKYSIEYTGKLSNIELVNNPDQSRELFNNDRLTLQQQVDYASSLSASDEFEINEGSIKNSKLIKYEGENFLIVNDIGGGKTIVGLDNGQINKVSKNEYGAIVQTLNGGGDVIFDNRGLALADSPYLQQVSRQQGSQQPQGLQQGQQNLQGIISQIQQVVGLLEGIRPQQGQTNVGGNDRVSFDNGGGGILSTGEEFGQNCYQGPGPDGKCMDESSKLRAFGEETLFVSNTLAKIPEQLDAYTNEETELLLTGISGDSLLTSNTADLLASDYNQGQLSSFGITAAVIGDLGGGNYVKLIGHDLGLGGNRILVDILKTFDEIQGDGSKLWVKNGEMFTKFDGIKIYHSRRIKSSDHSIGLIDNIRDSENHFSIIKYKNDRARLMDEKRRVSIGDLAISHPRENALNIAKIRENMWVSR